MLGDVDGQLKASVDVFSPSARVGVRLRVAWQIG